MDTQPTLNSKLRVAFIGGGNMASALAIGMADRICPAGQIHAIDINPDCLTAWRDRGATTAAAADEQLAQANVWFFAVKPQYMRDAVQACQKWLRPGTLVISVAAGLRGDVLAGWLGQCGEAWGNLVRCMPNTPALVGAGVTGMLALPGVSETDRALAESMLRSVGQVVWVDDDAGIDAVTSLSGSGPAYVFRFLEALIAGGVAQGLTEAQAKQMALGTFAGATKLASESSETPGVLRERVTSKGGTTAAALKVFDDGKLMELVARAMAAAAQRSRELAQEFGK